MLTCYYEWKHSIHKTLKNQSNMDSRDKAKQGITFLPTIEGSINNYCYTDAMLPKRPVLANRLLLEEAILMSTQKVSFYFMEKRQKSSFKTLDSFYSLDCLFASHLVGNDYFLTTDFFI